jgi:ABC-type lipoprotein release transport system permease subunit
MSDYKQLAIKYLKSNIERCIITIIGVVLTVVVLYGALNAAYSWFIKTRDDVRANADYEFVLMTDDKSVAVSIAQDDRIARAYIGNYEYTSYSLGDEESYVYKNALYATGRNPYKMEKTLEALCQDYDIEGELNSELAVYYFQADDDGSGPMVMLLFVLLVSYIFAIFAVGIIRNTIQMFMLEQVKDYGILRCVGCTKKQLRWIIYVMGAVQEVFGIVIGIVLGGFLTYIIGIFLGIDMGYHVVPMIPVIVAYLGDLYLLIRENSKLVVNMPPISAVKGQFRIKKEKIKSRGRGLMGLIFGIEGEYARKNVLRNKGRFFKTVAGLSVSIAGCIAVLSIYSCIDNMGKQFCSYVGDYQLKIVSTPSIFYDYETVETNILSAQEFEKLADFDVVLESKKVHNSVVYTADCLKNYSKVTEEYLKSSNDGYLMKDYMSSYTDEDSSIIVKCIGLTQAGGFCLEGLDDDDLSSLDKYLVAGTTDVSENGIVVAVGGSCIMENDDDIYMYGVNLGHLKQNNYQVGDTIDIVDTEILYNKVWEAFKNISEQYGDDDSTPGVKMIDKYTSFWEIYNQMLADKQYKTYVVEGIVDMGDTQLSGFTAYTSLDNYYAETGTDSSVISGVKYKLDIDNITLSDINDMYMYAGGYEEYNNYDIPFLYLYSQILTFQNVLKYVFIAVVFIFLLSSVNIINTAAGNIHMRRKELAQLRVIGMSRDRLIKTVMLEGLMIVIVSNIVGGIIGTGIYCLEYYFMNLIMIQKFAPNIWVYIFGIFMSAVLIFGSLYVPLRRLPQSMAEDLTLEE